MELRKWVVGPFQCNCRLIACPKTGIAALVDPGDEAQTILKGLNGLTLPGGTPIQVKWLLHTHGHLDHIAATREVKKSFPHSKIALHRGDEPLYAALKKQGQLFGFSYDDPSPVE